MGASNVIAKLAFICVFIIAIGCGGQKQAGSTGCPGNFLRGGGALASSCYLFVPQYASWIDATRKCAEYGSTLVNIESETEQRALVDFIEDHEETWKEQGASRRIDVNFWTSLSNGHDVESWVWYGNLADLTYEGWHANQPSDFRQGEEQRCVEMKGIFDFAWNDAQCTRQSFYICETLAADN